MRIRTPLSATAALTAVLVLSNCSGSTPDSEQGDDGEGGFVVAVRDGDNNVVPLLADAWNEVHPDQPATVEILDGNPDQQRQQLSLELDAGSTDFDVLGLDVTWTGEFADNGWLADLSDRLPAAEAVSYPGPLASGSYDDHQYAYPLLVGVGLLYYRTDLISEPATTWDELSTQVVDAADEADLGGFAGQGAAYEGMVCNFLEYLWGAGGDLYNEDLSEVTLLDGDAASRALDFMTTSYTDGLYAPGFNTMTEAEARAAFESGEVVTMRHWVAPYLPMSTSEDSAVVDDFDVAPLPTFDGGNTVSALGGLNLAVNADSAHIDAASDFVEWATTDTDAQMLLAENGIGPASTEAYTDEAVADSRFLEVLAEILPDARPRPPLPQWGDISATMSRELFEAYTGQKSSGDALEAIAASLQSAIDE